MAASETLNANKKMAPELQGPRKPNHFGSRLKGKFATPEERKAYKLNGKAAKWFRSLAGKRTYYQKPGFMGPYVNSAVADAPTAKMFAGAKISKPVSKDNALDSLSNTLGKAYGKIVNAIWGKSKMVGAVADKLATVASSYAPFVKGLVEKIKKSGLEKHNSNQLILAFRNSLVDAILEDYQKEQEKLPEDERRPITASDVGDYIMTRKEFADLLLQDVKDADKGQTMKATEAAVKAIGELEKKDGKSPASLKDLQNDTLETIKALHSLGLMDEQKLFDWLK